MKRFSLHTSFPSPFSETRNSELLLLQRLQASAGVAEEMNGQNFENSKIKIRGE